MATSRPTRSTWPLPLSSKKANSPAKQEATARDPALRSCDRGVFSSCFLCKPVQGDGSSPGLVIGAERLAGVRLEILGKAARRQLLEGSPAQVRGPLFLAGLPEGAPEQPGDHWPDRAAPVRARVKPGLLRARAGRQRPAQRGISRELRG